jgi:hypothetical protein
MGGHRIRHYDLFAGTVRAHNIERPANGSSRQSPRLSTRPPRQTVTPKHFRQRIDAPVAAGE